MIQLTQGTFGIQIEVAGDTVAFAINAALFIPAPKGFALRISPALLESGFKVTKRGYRLPAKGTHAVIMVLDPDLMEATLRPLTQKLVVQTTAALSVEIQNSWDAEKISADANSRIDQLFSMISEDDELYKLMAAVMNGSDEALAGLKPILAALMQIKWAKLLSELDSLLEPHKTEMQTIIPAPESIEPEELEELDTLA